MITWGISAGGHDAAIAVIKDQEITWAAHSERYSKVKDCDWLDVKLIDAALEYGRPDNIVWHERNWLKRTREIFIGDWESVWSSTPKQQLNALGLGNIPIKSVSHHHSHAAGGYFTSGFTSAAILVVDAVGEWETITAWHATGNNIRKIASLKYPQSMGMFYSAMTQRCGFKPNGEEYIMMGLSAFGNSNNVDLSDIITENKHWPFFRLQHNLHWGIGDWHTEYNIADIAAAAQEAYTCVLLKISSWLKSLTNEPNLVLSGGCALNCVANTALAKQGHWDNIWIMPNSGDAGNSLGAAVAYCTQHVQWSGPYLGHNIIGEYPVDLLLQELLAGRPVGVANGRAEFGPRALGNRSLLVDPRLPDIKSTLNKLKHREEFRPFAPVILAEHAASWFEDIGQDLSYMQYAVKCLRPTEIPGVVHVDGTSRVQTVKMSQNFGLHRLLSKWYAKTGCPVLVNTSLNCKGEPIVNDLYDANKFEQTTGIRVLT